MVARAGCRHLGFAPLIPPCPRWSTRETMYEAWQEHTKIVRWEAKRKARGIATYDDLYAAGLVGLWQAAERFDPDNGANFETFAKLRVNGAIADHLRDMFGRDGRHHQAVPIDAYEDFSIGVRDKGLAAVDARDELEHLAKGPPLRADGAVQGAHHTIFWKGKAQSLTDWAAELGTSVSLLSWSISEHGLECAMTRPRKRVVVQGPVPVSKPPVVKTPPPAHTYTPPADIHSAARQQIKLKARYVIARYGFTRFDIPDVEQELALQAHVATPQFKNERGTAATYFSRVLDNRVASLLAHASRQKRDRRRDIQVDDWSVFCRDITSSVDLRIDVADALATLTPADQQIAELLKTDTVAGVARWTGSTRAHVRCAKFRIARALGKRGLVPGGRQKRQRRTAAKLNECPA